MSSSSPRRLQAPASSSFLSAGEPSVRVSQVSRHLHSGPALAMASSASSTAAASSKHGKAKEADAGEPLVLASANGNLRTIVLNRPKALNALNIEMIRLIRWHLESFAKEASSASVIALRGEGRALCSGGDVLAVVGAANSKDETQRQNALTFFQEEFELDHMIATLGERSSAAALKAGSSASPKAFISFMDGITMGGGVGLSLHAPFRVATENTLFAMPETGIGYFPDVGVTRCLARLDGKIGQYLGLTGARISGPEAYLIGIASHYVSSSNIQTVLDRLAQLPQGQGGDANQRVANLLDEYATDPFNADASEKQREILRTTPFLGEKRIALDYVFGQPSAEAIFSALTELSAGGNESQAARELSSLARGLRNGVSADIANWAGKTLETLKTKSPRSLKVTHLAIQEARRLDVDEAFRFDMRLATAFCDLSIGRDFYEGVTFTLTKDPTTGKRREGIAAWDPPSLAQVDDQRMRAQFFGGADVAQRAGLRMTMPVLSGLPKPDTSREAKRAREHALRGKGPLGWEPAYNPFALPSEAECAALLEGSHPAASSVKLDVDEMVDVLRRYKGEKPTLQLKVSDWAQRTSQRGAGRQ
ncbi:ClpP/crotonase [Tilletiaria anomala UBC 951]|uniref:3-hydroxyisobutyryl-CoA hydrolase n=1 Tax=Tilletiaria anomala (strain ATCC 24038 / CBS 436.72 / UBC 951) TaxID=1037660 RepID=A0A066W3H0_TILAU|nr:ClpP/crotonase [Tilletiaria anomala UBC 951]KDN48507.1 ClpP/crotonase [Tilletiaria anomala UBC 951]